MSTKISVLILLTVFSYLATEVVAKVEFTNIVCTSLDKEFSDFEYCYMKSVNRTYKYFSFKCNLFQSPITKVKLNISMHKRFNGYRPFMFNFTIDACRFLKNPKSSPVTSFFVNLIFPFSNLNHPCPFSDAVIIDKVSAEFINHHFTNVLPFPEGDYMIEVNWIAYDIHRAVTKFYGTLS